MNDKLSTYELVGYIDKNTAELANLKYTGNVYAAPGVLKHIHKRHKHELSEYVLNNLINVIKLVVNSPEYIGHHKNKEGCGIEFIRQVDSNILVAAKFDITDEYLYIASLYPITSSKISSKLHSGKLKKCEILNT
ncbi:MAG: hypothetical protein KIB00_17200 [Paeniclostridium sordellii]|nr:hypothetical protein [Paeniclostridium sordellii]